MAFTDTAGRRKLPQIAGVAIVHAAIGYALITGLTYQIIKLPDTFSAYWVPADPPPPPPNLDPLPRAKQRLPKATAEPLPQPHPDASTSLARPDDALNRTTVDLQPLPPFEFTRPPLPPVDRTTQASARGDRTAWITAEDYPAAALRDGVEGTVAISAAIDARGRVTGCTVTGSSGHDALDRATCRLYTSRARFTPAHDAAGQAAGATLSDRVVWRIPR